MKSEIPNISIAAIEGKASSFAIARENLAIALTEMQDKLETVKREAMRRIKFLAGKAAEAEAELRTSVELAPDLFKKPRTLTLHGIKVGYRSAEGKIAFDDSATVIKLIHRHFKDKADLLIRTKEEPNKDGLKTLPETDLSKIACRIVDRGDQVVCTPVDDEIEKLISKLINDMVETVLDQQEAA